jgi:hypothetical protein
MIKPSAASESDSNSLVFISDRLVAFQDSSRKPYIILLCGTRSLTAMDSRAIADGLVFDCAVWDRRVGGHRSFRTN